MKRKDNGRKFDVPADVIRYLTSHETLRRQVHLSLPLRCNMIEQETQYVIDRWKLRRLYQKYKISSKRVQLQYLSERNVDRIIIDRERLDYAEFLLRE